MKKNNLIQLLHKDTNAMIYHDGRVFWPVPTKLQSTCKFDVTFFPFDVQRCFLKIGILFSLNFFHFFFIMN